MDVLLHRARVHLRFETARSTHRRRLLDNAAAAWGAMDPDLRRSHTAAAATTLGLPAAVSFSDDPEFAPHVHAAAVEVCRCIVVLLFIVVSWHGSACERDLKTVMSCHVMSSPARSCCVAWHHHVFFCHLHCLRFSSL
jgi:hypothetical protein